MKSKLNKKFIKDFWSLFNPFWNSEEKWSALLFISLSIIFTISGIKANVALNNFYKDFFDALEHFDKSAIFIAFFHFILITIVWTLSYGYAYYFNGILGIRWRRWLTKNYIKRWLNNHNYYKNQIDHKQIDNPDQRISEDLELFCSTTLNVFFMFLQASISLISFSYILWNLSGTLSIPMGAFHIKLVGYLFWSALLYGLLGIWITMRFSKKLSELDYHKQRNNADFRFALIRIREFSEQIALYKSELTEKNRLSTLFHNVITNSIHITTLQKKLTFFSSGYQVTANTIGMIIALPLYLQKQLQLSNMLQVSSAIGAVVSAFGILVSGFALLSEWRAVIYRLKEFDHELLRSRQSNQLKINFTQENDCNVVINNLTLYLPDGNEIININKLHLNQKESYLITGKSGTGKSTLLRALAGIWDYGEGQIQLPNKKIFILPQKPYLPDGSLKEILLYPYDMTPINNTAIHEALALCFLDKIKNKLDEVKRWASELSLGEQQLISLARIFLHKPEIIFLDEATSALDENTEYEIYNNLNKRFPQALIVSIGHRNSLKRYHKKIIHLEKSTELLCH